MMINERDEIVDFEIYMHDQINVILEKNFAFCGA